MKYGLSPSEYWEMSYEELGAYLESMVEKEKDDFISNLQLAYYTAIFSNVKDPYSIYKKVINELDKKEMTNDDMENMVRKLNALFGGKVVKKGGG